MLCVTSSFNHFRTGRGIHDDVDVLASVIFGWMALTNLNFSIRTWVLFNVCLLSFLTSFNKNHLHPISLYCYVGCTIHFGMLFRFTMQDTCTFVMLVVEFYAFAGLWSTFLELSMKSIALYVAIRLEAWLSGGKFERVQNFQGANFYYIYHLTGFSNAFHTLQRNKAPHGKEHLSHTQNSDKCDVE